MVTDTTFTIHSNPSFSETRAPHPMQEVNERLPQDAQLDLASQLTPPTVSLGTAESLSLYFILLAPEQRLELALNFATTVNASFPLFEPKSFLDRLTNGAICSNLTSIVYAISAKVMGTPSWCGDIQVDTAFREMSNAATIETECVFEPTALDEWRKACLLAWYHFHQRPETADLDRMTVLMRKPYHYGLHQIDSVDDLKSFGWNLVGNEALEEWRHTWWCIYIPDSYASYATAAPHQVEDNSIQTALLHLSSPSDTSENSDTKRLFLPSDQSCLWKLGQEITTNGGDRIFSLHMAINMLQRESLVLHRLRKQNPDLSAGNRLSALEDHLSAVQLALPRNYMQQTRDLMSGESSAGYNARLQTLLKIYSIRLLLRLPSRDLNEAQWQENLGICYHIFEVIQQWDMKSILTVDLAVYFIVLPILVLLHLHSHYSGISNQALIAQLTRRREVIRLFLQNYGTHWSLPRFLLRDVFQILVLSKIFHNRSLRFLGSSSDKASSQFLSPSWVPDFYKLDPHRSLTRHERCARFNASAELPIQARKSNKDTVLHLKGRIVDTLHTVREKLVRKPSDVADRGNHANKRLTWHDELRVNRDMIQEARDIWLATMERMSQGRHHVPRVDGIPATRRRDERLVLDKQVPPGWVPFMRALVCNRTDYGQDASNVFEPMAASFVRLSLSAELFTKSFLGGLYPPAKQAMEPLLGLAQSRCVVGTDMGLVGCSYEG
ncbi:hypothetical protein NM208_g4273 [Fusarium decemcellulare]|uniref:Uncharacterized protein n=1 Tax=Fusarium decemcellulare TaxID=57161 RepID=A0ACC1SLC7_9HYPO|nr:hypothetical protein NM208_g4273 [Fusarium decemcellulare]